MKEVHGYIEHPLIKPFTIQRRLYQELILATAVKGNTLVVLPTGLGKTAIAIMLSALRLEKYEGRVIFLAPTKPLCMQHCSTFQKSLAFPANEFSLVTGEISPEKRRIKYGSKFIFVTPQTLLNDLLSQRTTLNDVCLMIFDEAHRAVGRYPYVMLAKLYMQSAENPLILALTASPGDSLEKIEEIKKNLFIKYIEARDERSFDVRPYVKRKKIKWVRIDLPQEFKEIKRWLEDTLREHLRALKELGVIESANLKEITKRDLLDLQKSIIGEIAINNADQEIYSAMVHTTACLKVYHALELLETQGMSALCRYFERLEKQKSKAVRMLMEDIKFRSAIVKAKYLSKKMEHPKLEKLKEIVGDYLKREKDSKIIIFCQYRDSIDRIIKELEQVKEARPIRFVGQATRNNSKGMRQKEQLEIIKKFKEGVYNVLVASSVAEEGLDIPEVNLVVFYEPVPSAIRSIQRKGRTGRIAAGDIIILVTKETRDEAYYWASYYKEKKMKEILSQITT